MPPVHLDGMVLVDGAIVNRLPSDVVRAAGVQVAVGVDAGMILGQPFQIQDGIDVINRSMEIMGFRLGQIARDHSDLLIRLDNGAVNWMHFQNCAKLISEGQKAAELMIDRIKRAVAPPISKRLFGSLSRRPAAIRRRFQQA
jgi:NTE family protein